MNDLEKKYYESEAFWTETALADTHNSRRIEFTASIVPDDCRSLADIGCGNGIFLKHLRLTRPEMELVGIDRSEEALKYVSVPKRVGDVTKIPLEAESYDCVVCSQVLEHIPIPNYDKALSEISRVAKKYLIVSVPYMEKLEFGATTCPYCRSTFNRDLHVRSYSQLTLERLFDTYGFRHKTSENLVKSIEFRGLNWWNRIRNRNLKKVFESPICAICGFVNEDFSLDGTKQSPKQPPAMNGVIFMLKKIMKAIWPKRMIDGYWIVCLYERTNR